MLRGYNKINERNQRTRTNVSSNPRTPMHSGLPRFLADVGAEPAEVLLRDDDDSGKGKNKRDNSQSIAKYSHMHLLPPPSHLILMIGHSNIAHSFTSKIKKEVLIASDSVDF